VTARDDTNRPRSAWREIGAHPLAGQMGRYAITGIVVAIVYIGATLGLSGPGGLPVQVAIPVAILIAAILHFTMQRFFVFASGDEYQLGMTGQLRRYAVLNAGQYVATAAGTALGHHVLGLRQQVAYVICALAITSVTFLFLRTRVFHATGA